MVLFDDPFKKIHTPFFSCISQLDVLVQSNFIPYKIKLLSLSDRIEKDFGSLVRKKVFSLEIMAVQFDTLI